MVQFMISRIVILFAAVIALSAALCTLCALNFSYAYKETVDNGINSYLGWHRIAFEIVSNGVAQPMPEDICDNTSFNNHNEPCTVSGGTKCQCSLAYKFDDKAQEFGDHSCDPTDPTAKDEYTGKLLGTFICTNVGFWAGFGWMVLAIIVTIIFAALMHGCVFGLGLCVGVMALIGNVSGFACGVTFYKTKCGSSGRSIYQDGMKTDSGFYAGIFSFVLTFLYLVYYCGAFAVLRWERKRVAGPAYGVDGQPMLNVNMNENM